MSAVKPVHDLADDQKFALMKFRRNVADVTRPEHDDYFLLRWLRARKWDVDAAEKMLRNSFKARIMWNVENLDKWDCPKVLLDYVPQGMICYDKEGSPVLMCHFAGLDMWGLLHCVTRFDFQRYTVLLLERFLAAGFEMSKTHGPQSRQLVVFFDMADFNLKQYMWRPVAELITNMIKSYEANYPEILKMCYIINAPKIFSVAFNFVKKFLDEYTTSKMKIYKSGSEKWKADFFSHVDKANFPKYYGGEMVDENGDPKCMSKVCWGGKVPVELYTKQNDENVSNKSFQEGVVNKGQKLKIELETKDEENQILAWEFRTFDYDIKFGIYSLDLKTGEKTSEVHLGNVHSHEMDEIGFITCRPQTKYVVVFDNSGSYIRNKKIRYFVDLVSEIADSDDMGPQAFANDETDSNIPNLTEDLQKAAITA